MCRDILEFCTFLDEGSFGGSSRVVCLDCLLSALFLFFIRLVYILFFIMADSYESDDSQAYSPKTHMIMNSQKQVQKLNMRSERSDYDRHENKKERSYRVSREDRWRKHDTSGDESEGKTSSKYIGSARNVRRNERDDRRHERLRDNESSDEDEKRNDRNNRKNRRDERNERDREIGRILNLDKIN